jgi:hypothetical protein
MYHDDGEGGDQGRVSRLSAKRCPLKIVDAIFAVGKIARPSRFRAKFPSNLWFRPKICALLLPEEPHAAHKFKEM